MTFVSIEGYSPPCHPRTRAKGTMPERTKKEDKKASLSYKPSDASDAKSSHWFRNLCCCLVGGGRVPCKRLMIYCSESPFRKHARRRLEALGVFGGGGC
jgi:hypothetical protein